MTKILNAAKTYRLSKDYLAGENIASFEENVANAMIARYCLKFFAQSSNQRLGFLCWLQKHYLKILSKNPNLLLLLRQKTGGPTISF